jgi:hypothetical protein
MLVSISSCKWKTFYMCCKNASGKPTHRTEKKWNQVTFCWDRKKKALFYLRREVIHVATDVSPSGGLPSIPPQTRGPPASPARLGLFLLHAQTLSFPHVAGDEQPPSHLLSPPHLLLVRRRGTKRQAAGIRAGARRELPGPFESGAARVRARRGREGGRRGAEEGVHACGELGFGEVAVRDAWYGAMLSSVSAIGRVRVRN